MSRRPAFDPSRLDDDLDQLLPPPTAAADDTHAGTAPAGPRDDRDTAATAEPAVAESDRQPPARPARGSGGRPRRDQDEVDEPPAVSAVRIPKPLYDAVVSDLLAGMIERPSYAQIVAWTCEDHPADVLAELEHATSLTARAPRGRKLATEVVPLALRFRPDERRVLDELVARGSAAGRITRTAAVTAALRVAVKYGLASSDTGDSRQ